MKLRIDQPPAWAGRFVVQYFAPEIGAWFDHGDPVDTRREAEVKLAHLRAGTYPIDVI